MAEFEKIRFDESEVLEGLRNIHSELSKIKDVSGGVSDDFSKSMKKAATDANTLDKAIESTEKEMNSLAKQAKETKKESDQLGKSVSTLANDINIMGVNVGGLVGKMRTKITALKGVVAGLNSTSGALKVLKVALISTGIGAIIVALGSFVAFLTKTQRGLDKVNVVLASVGAAISVIVDRMSQFGEAITKVFKGDFKGAFEQAKSAVSGLGEELAKDIAGAAELERRSQALRDAQRELNVEYAETRRKVKELNLIAEDTTKSESERAEAARQAIGIERSLLEKRKNQLKEDLEIQQQRNALGESLTADLDAEAEKRIAIAQAEQESLELQTTLNNKLNTIAQTERAAKKAAYDEFIARQKELNDALNTELKLIQDQLLQIDLQNLSAEDRLKRELEIANAAIDKQVELVNSLAQQLDKEIDITADAERIKQRLAEETFRRIETLRNENLKQLSKSGEKEVKQTQSLFKQYDETATETLERLRSKLPPPVPDLSPENQNQAVNEVKAFLRKIGDVYDDPQFKESIAAIGQAFDSVFEGLSAQIDSEIADNERWLEDIRSLREELESELELELERQEQGRANRVDIKKQELADLATEEAKAQKQAEELRKKQLRLQLLQDGARQVSDLVTAAAHIIKNFSEIPFVGIALGIAAVAGMFAFFAKAKAQAKAASGQRAYEGGSLAELLGANRSSEDRHGVGRGYRLEGTDLVIGGDEFLVNKTSAQNNRQFLNALNKGQFDNIDLSSLMSFPELERVNGKFRRRSRVIENTATVAQRRATRQLFSDSVRQQTVDLISYWKSRPIIVSYRDGDRIRTVKGTDVVDIRV